MVYAAHALSLAALEYLVHVDPDDAPTDLVALAIAMPEHEPLDSWDRTTLPTDWRALTPPPACQAMGDAWVRTNRALGVRVPSVIIPGEWNLLLNPAHSAMAQVAVVDAHAFTFDPRLLHRT